MRKSNEKVGSTVLASPSKASKREKPSISLIVNGELHMLRIGTEPDEVGTSHTLAHTLRETLGLTGDVPVVAGGHDKPCGALGAGVVEPGLAMYATGTVECICPAFDKPIFAEELFRNNLCTYDHTLRGMYTTVLFSLTGGNLLQWFRDQWGRAEVEEAERTGADAYDLLLGRMASEPTDLLALPYFTPSGTPYFDAKTPGAILGLRLGATREDVSGRCWRESLWRCG